MILQHLSWASYLTIIVSAAIIYYVVVLLRYYVPQWKRDKPTLPVNTLFQDTAAVPAAEESGDEELYTDDGSDEIDTLIAAIKQAAALPGQEPAPLATLRQNLKQVLQSYPGLKDSPHRPAINELIVSECEKHGQALLTEAEVDLWWTPANPLANPPGPAPIPQGWPR